MAKIRNFDSFGAVLPHFCPDKRKIWHGGADQISRLSWQRVAPPLPACGRKTHFGQLSKNNAGMAALRAGLPVIIGMK